MTPSRFSPLYLTFLKTIGSSSHTGLMALLFWEVLVFSAFLLVSAGSPNISTSTYTPTRRSVRNWPEITYDTHRDVETDRYTQVTFTQVPQQGQFIHYIQSNVCFPPGLSHSHTSVKWSKQTKGFNKGKPLHLHREGVGYDAIHCVFCERVEVFVWSSHELGLKSVAAPTVVLKHEEIQLRG